MQERRVTPGEIDRYLEQLGRELRVPSRRRRRILIEAREHLHDVRVELTGAGLPAAEAEQAAVRRFGPAREVGRCFVEELAAVSARRAAAVATAAVAAGVAGFLGAGLATAAAGMATSSVAALAQVADPRVGAALIVAFQVATVAGVLGLVRWLRWSVRPAIPAADLRLLVRSSGVAAGAVAAGVACEVAVLLQLPVGAATGRVGVALAGAVAAGGLLAAVAAVAVAQAAAWAARLERSSAADRRPAPADVLDDVNALVELARARSAWRWPTAARLLDRTVAAGCGAWRRLEAGWPALTSWVDLRQHPWRVCAAVALADALGSLQQRAMARSAASALEWMGLEVVAVVAGFGLLGGYLGIRPSIRARGNGRPPAAPAVGPPATRGRAVRSLSGEDPPAPRPTSR
jgi:hypothetical protein